MVSADAMRQRAAETFSRLTGQSVQANRVEFPYRSWGNSTRLVIERDERVRAYFSVTSRPSFGAPVPDEPTNSFLPSGKVMSRPLARAAPSLAWKPSTRISVPAGSESRFQPRRIKAFGAPPSTIQVVTVPSAFLTSMWIHECGLIHSIFFTVPRSLTGFLASNSAANE